MTPLYAHVLRDLIGRIERGEFRPDQPIPTEQELCEMYGVSRITVRRAVERLVATRADLPPSRDRHVPFSARTRTASRCAFRTDRGRADLRPEARHQSAEARHANAAAAGSPGVRHRRKALRHHGGELLDDKPYSLTRSFFAPELAEYGPRIRVTDGQTAIRSIQDITEVRVKSGEQTIEPAIARGETARHLGIKPGTAVITTTRTYFEERRRPIEAVRVHYHPERYHFRVELLTTDSFEV